MAPADTVSRDRRSTAPPPGQSSNSARYDFRVVAQTQEKEYLYNILHDINE